jgi:hypothetical protein
MRMALDEVAGATPAIDLRVRIQIFRLHPASNR